MHKVHTQTQDFRGPVGAKIFSEYEMYMMTLKNLFLGSHGQASSRDEMLGPTDEK